VTVLGAGGRAGRAISEALVSHGCLVTGLVRNDRHHGVLRALGIRVVTGDATVASDVAMAMSGTDAVVNAVTPFSTPPPDLEAFDEGFYEKIIAAISASASSARTLRVVTVGLFAMLSLPDGTKVMDDPDRFPAQLRPFARAHAREAQALRRSELALDWLVAIPPAGLGDREVTEGSYRLSEPVMRLEQLTSALGYKQLAGAVADQILLPTHHRQQVAIISGVQSPP